MDGGLCLMIPPAPGYCGVFYAAQRALVLSSGEETLCKSQLLRQVLRVPPLQLPITSNLSAIAPFYLKDLEVNARLAPLGTCHTLQREHQGPKER